MGVVLPEPRQLFIISETSALQGFRDFLDHCRFGEMYRENKLGRLICRCCRETTMATDR